MTVSDPPWDSVEPLASYHGVSSFCSSHDAAIHESIDVWLQRYALQEHKNRSTTHVCVKSGQVVGYFSLSTVVVDLSCASKGVKRYTQAGTDCAPAVLIAKLGLCEKLQGQGNGTLLLRTACEMAYRVNNLSPVRLIVVDAFDSHLVPFYEKHGMHLISPEDHRLFMKMSTVGKLLNKS